MSHLLSYRRILDCMFRFLSMISVNSKKQERIMLIILISLVNPFESNVTDRRISFFDVKR